ncbi:MAG: EamA family transporter [Methylovirgula sp.]
MFNVSNSLQGKSYSLGENSGVLANISARGIWGAATLYFSMASAKDSLRIFEQRVLWAFVFLWLIVFLRWEWAGIIWALVNPSVALSTAAAFLSIAINWFVVIRCAKNGQLVATGIGFFLVPLLMIFAGALLFSEAKLSDTVLSLVLRVIGVLFYFKGSLSFPWPVFAVAISTTIYTLLRKTCPLATFPANILEIGFALIGVTTLIVLASRGTEATRVVTNLGCIDALIKASSRDITAYRPAVNRVRDNLGLALRIVRTREKK